MQTAKRARVVVLLTDAKAHGPVGAQEKRRIGEAPIPFLKKMPKSSRAVTNARAYQKNYRTQALGAITRNAARIAKNIVNTVSGAINNRGNAMVSVPAIAAALGGRGTQTRRNRARPPGNRQKTSLAAAYSGTGGPGVTRTKWHPKYKPQGKVAKAAKKMFSKDGAARVVEVSGNIQCPSAETLYIMHACATEQFWVNACRAIIRQLYRDAGEEISAWDQAMKGDTGARTLQYQYTIGSNPTSVLTANVVPTAAQTYDGFATQLYNSFQTSFSTSDASINLIQFFLFNTAAPQLCEATVQVSNMKLIYRVKSRLKIQNQSLAGTTTAEVDDDVTDNVSRNPLVGRVYVTKYRGTGFKPIHQATHTQGYQTVNHQTGLQFAASNGLPSFMRKPPPAKVLNSKMMHRINIEPGEIKINHWEDYREIKFSQLVEELQKSFSDAVNNFQHVGYCQTVALEKEMHANVNENPIFIHYALEQHYDCVVRKTKSQPPKMVQIGNVTATVL